MKKLYPYLLVALAVLMPMTLWADDDPFDTTHKLFRDKHVTSNPDGTYTLDLETYATGYTKQTMAYVPTDFMLVLDCSGSMYQNYLRGNRVSTGDQLVKDKMYQIVIDSRTYNLVYATDGQLKKNSSTMNLNQKGWWLCLSGTSKMYDYDVTPVTSGGKSYYPHIRISDQEKYKVQKTDEIYEVTSVSRLDALKTAVTDFLQAVYKNNPDGTMKHRVSVVWYAGYNGTYSMCSSDLNQTYGFTELTTKTVLENYKTKIVAVDGTEKPGSSYLGSGTLSDAGLSKAWELMYASRNDGRNKVTIFFTDGEPGVYSGFFHAKTARTACMYAEKLKSADLQNKATGGSGNEKTFDPVVYSIGIMDSHSSYRIVTESGLTSLSGSAGNYDKYRFMHYISSNYDIDVSSSSTYNFNSDFSGATCSDESCTGHGSEDPHGYFMRSDGSDLSSAFAQIAEKELKDRNEDLTDTKTVVKDVMSSNFRLPAANPSAIKLYTCDADKNNKTDKVVWRTTGDTGDPSDCKTVYKDADNKTIWKTGDAGSKPTIYDHIEYWKPLKTATVSVPDTKTVSVTGYDYVEHFVGPIHDFTDDETNNIAGWTGQKLIMEFVIEKEPSCPGGGTLDTNDPGSGVYVTPSTLPLSSYPVPDVGIPNIEVVVKGLTSTDGSAVFEIVKVTDPTGETIATTNPYKATVVLSSANNTAELVSVGYGYYKVTQKTWDWKHNVKYDGDSDGTPETEGTSYVLHMEDPGSGTKPNKITFTFGNALKSGTLPDSDEKSVNNIFKP